MATVAGFRSRFASGTIRGQSVLAGVALLLIFGSMASLAVWRINRDRAQHATIQRRAATVANIQEARADIFLSGAFLAAAALSDQPATFVDSYHAAMTDGEASLANARTLLVQDNDPNVLSGLDRLDEELKQLHLTLDSLSAIAVNIDTNSRASMGIDYLPKLWPSVSAVLDDLAELTGTEQTSLTSATAGANREAGASLWLLVAFGIAGFLVGLAVLANLIRSVVQPLASLQRSVRAVASGDMESRADVSGPQEVASLATDFNDMIGRLNTASTQMRHRLEVESAVGRVSALLDTTEDVDSALNSALQILAEAVDAEHSYIFIFKDDHAKMDNTHEWNAPGRIVEKERFANLDCPTYAWWVGKLLHNEEVILHDLSQLPPQAVAEKALLDKMGAKCALAVPFGPNGKPAGFIGFGDNRQSHTWREEDVRLLRLGSETISSFITRRQAEHALRESEERFRSLSDSAPVGIFLTDSTGASIYVNQWLLSISGMTLDQTIGLGWTTSIHAEDRDRVVQEKKRANRANDEFTQDFRIVTPQDNVRWVSVRSRPIGDTGQRVGTIEDITERKLADDALRQSEERFRSLGASAPIGIFQTDARGTTVFQNDRLKEMLQQSFGPEFPWGQAVHPDDRKEVVGELIKSLGASVEFAKEFRILTPDGAVRWISVHARDLRSGSGELTGVVGTIEDVTERKHAEDALRQSEERFRSLGASAPIGIFQTDTHGEAVFTNDRLEQIAGIRFGPEYHWYDAVHPEERDDVIREVFKSIADRKEFAKEMRFLTPRGVTHWIRVHAKDLRSKDGRFAGVIGTAEDITERKHADEALRQSEARFRSLSASAPIGIFLTDDQHRLTYTNECLRDIVGFSPKERQENADADSAMAEFVHPDDRRDVAQAHIEALSRDVYDFLKEFRILTSKGEQRWVRVHVTPVSSGDGDQTGLVGTVEDITEHKTLEEERQKAYERTTLLLAMAAEARDPYTEHHLYRIRGYSEAIALRMGLTLPKAKEIGLVSLLHRVPDAILTKPGPLSEDEWKIMRRHTAWGEELLPANAWFTTAREIARCHHENWDGSGYPDGLKGDDIPLAATIVAVADGFDAMTSKRPYKNVWPSARAMRELQADSGHRYSPTVVQAFERAVAEGVIARIAGVRNGRLSDLMKAA